MEMNSVMATEFVAAEVEHIVLPQIVSIKQASQMLGCHRIISEDYAKRSPELPFSPASNGISTWVSWLTTTTTQVNSQLSKAQRCRCVKGVVSLHASLQLLYKTLYSLPCQ